MPLLPTAFSTPYSLTSLYKDDKNTSLNKDDKDEQTKIFKTSLTSLFQSELLKDFLASYLLTKNIHFLYLYSYDSLLAQVFIYMVMNAQS